MNRYTYKPINYFVSRLLELYPDTTNEQLEKYKLYFKEHEMSFKCDPANCDRLFCNHKNFLPFNDIIHVVLFECRLDDTHLNNQCTVNYFMERCDYDKLLSIRQYNWHLFSEKALKRLLSMDDDDSLILKHIIDNSIDINSEKSWTDTQNI